MSSPKDKGKPAKSALPDTKPFWVVKPLEAMSQDEWESLCDGCEQCCLLKVEDEDTSDVYLTRLACRLLDVGSCRCSDYKKRHSRVADCVVITPDNVHELTWLPESCAYRRLAEGRG
ncbi:MAG: YcgN family cysteine cluster protein, partial [Hyphomicrobium sp.]